MFCCQETGVLPRFCGKRLLAEGSISEPRKVAGRAKQLVRDWLKTVAILPKLLPRLNYSTATGNCGNAWDGMLGHGFVMDSLGPTSGHVFNWN